MRPEAFEKVVVQSPPGEFPIKSAQSSKRWTEIIRLSLMSLLAAAVVLPQLALAAYTLAAPETRALILERPIMTAELAVAMAFWIGLFAWPLRRLYARVNGRRSVEISRQSVIVRDEKLLNTEAWSAPLASYSGVAHHVRASLSGSRHELILIHPDPSRSVLLMVSEHITDGDVARFTRLLGLPQIQARALYGQVRQASRRIPADAIFLAEAA